MIKVCYLHPAYSANSCSVCEQAKTYEEIRKIAMATRQPVIVSTQIKVEPAAPFLNLDWWEWD